jgi:hypothetical protein
LKHLMNTSGPFSPFQEGMIYAMSILQFAFERLNVIFIVGEARNEWNKI